MSSYRQCVFLLLLFVARNHLADGQFTTKLEPKTVAAFEEYAKSVEDQLSTRWSGKRAFLSIDDVPAERAKALAGDLVIRPGAPDNPIEVPDGLVHDWLGAVFIPGKSIPDVLAVMQSFNRHSQIYPEIVTSRLISRHGDDLTGFWRLRRESIITVVFDVTPEAHYRRLSSDKWVCRTYAKHISEVVHPGSPAEQVLPPGTGHGYLWQFYAYWSLEAIDGGVLSECRTLSLSRTIPVALRWVVRPFVYKAPRDLLLSTLANTRAAVLGQK